MRLRRRCFILLTFIIGCLPTTDVLAQEICSRVATVNYQQVLVDTSSTKKGEGLRFYLEKDELAKSYLDQYQDQQFSHVRSAAMGTLGTLLLATGLFKASNSEQKGINRFKERKEWFLFGGLTLALNYLISSAASASNEKLLLKSIEEYNKRNLPRIFFGPFSEKGGKGIGAGLQKDF